jgi:hypothetical protein
MKMIKVIKERKVTFRKHLNNQLVHDALEAKGKGLKGAPPPPTEAILLFLSAFAILRPSHISSPTYLTQSISIHHSFLTSQSTLLHDFQLVPSKHKSHKPKFVEKKRE